MNTQPSYQPDDEARRIAVRRLIAGGVAGGAAAAALGGAAAYIAHDDELEFPGEEERQSRSDRGDRGDRHQRHESQPEAETQSAATAHPEVGGEHTYAGYSRPESPSRGDDRGDGGERGDRGADDDKSTVTRIPDDTPLPPPPVPPQQPTPPASPTGATPVNAEGPATETQPPIANETQPETLPTFEVLGADGKVVATIDLNRGVATLADGTELALAPGADENTINLVDGNGQVVGSINADSGSVVVGDVEVGRIPGLRAR